MDVEWCDADCGCDVEYVVLWNVVVWNGSVMFSYVELVVRGETCCNINCLWDVPWNIGM